MHPRALSQSEIVGNEIAEYSISLVTHIVDRTSAFFITADIVNGLFGADWIQGWSSLGC